jgi:diguanylate cyclase (GGDEF)-like protein
MNGAFFFMWIIHSAHGYLHFSENIYISAVRTIVAVLALCALTIAVAISERDKLFSKLSQLANHDDLTGILNRRAFTKAAEAITSSLSKGDICSMVLIDIDFFKKINDVWGHQKGDKVLVAFCQRLKQCIPDSQLFGRVGGEEFALLLAETTEINHQELINTIVNELSRHPLTIDNEPFPLTISAGMAAWSEGQKYETLFKYADLALYQAKNNGRNQWQEYLPCENTLPNQNFTPSLL